MRNLLIAVCFLAVLPASGFAQDLKQPGSEQNTIPAPSKQGASSVAGMVMDATGAALVGATVKVRDSGGREVTAQTDGTGHYTVTGLAAGPANVSVNVAGFADFSATAQLPVNGRSTIDCKMQLVETTTSVEVTGARAMEIETENAEVSGTLEQKQIVGIGLNGRNFLSLVTLTPGVSNQTGQDEAKVGVVGSAKFSVNGGRTEYNTFDVDGNDVLNTDIAASRGHTTLLVYPSLDSIQDMKVLTSNYGAQFGRSASGTVQVEVKGGGDHLHGNAYEFIRNEAFNARNYFDAPGKAPLYRRQDFGFTFGGPLAIPHRGAQKPAKTSFFVSEEWRKESTPLEFNQGVPTDAERGYNLATKSYTNVADFSDVCPPGGFSSFNSSQYPDCPGLGHGGTYNAYANNQFYIDPIAKSILETGVIPRANASSGCISSIGSCYVSSISPPTDYREDLGRIDRAFSDKWKLYATVVHDHWKTRTAVPEWATYVNSFPSVLNSFLGPGYSAVFHLTTVITPTFLNDFSMGATWQRVSLEDLPGPGVSFDRSGLDGVTDPMGSFFHNCDGGQIANGACSNEKLPSLVFAGTNAEYGGAGFNVDSSYMPWFHTRGVGTISDSMSKFFPRHALLFGAQLVGAARHELGGANGANSGDRQGLLTFTNNGCVNAAGNAFAAFEYNNYLLSYNDQGGGEACSYQQDNTQITYKVKYWTLEPYFQDNFKLTSRLTVNLGVRISLFDNWKPDGTTLENWNPAAFDPKVAANNNVTLDAARGYLVDATSTTSNYIGDPIPFDGQTLNPLLTNGLVRCGVNGVPDSCQSSHLFNTAPRVGFAWDPSGAGLTSIRAGYGIFYEHGTGSEANAGSLMGNPPEVVSMSEDNPDSYAAIGLAGNGHSGTESKTPIQTPLNMISIPTKTIWPYVQQWSFGVQQAINKDLQIGVAYVGSKGTRLAVASQLNQLPPVPAAENPFGPSEPLLQQSCEANNGVPGSSNNIWGTTPSYVFFTLQDGSPVYFNQNPSAFNALVAACDGYGGQNGNLPFEVARNGLRPYRGVGNVLAIRNAANSSYNSLQITAHHINAPVDIAATLTYSHSIDTASDRFSSTFVNAYDLAANRASSDFDQRFLINVNYVYPLPLVRWAKAVRDAFIPGPPYPGKLDDGNPWTPPDHGDLAAFAKKVFEDWSLSGLTIRQTGTPFSVINGASSNGVSVSDNAGFALDVGPDSYPDVAPHRGGKCYTRFQDTGTVGPIIGNSCSFFAPRALTQGNAGRNYLNNPGRTNWDAALLKDMKLREGTTLQFRAEAFNVFNNTQFILYDPTRGNTSSNTISCYGDVTVAYTAGASTCNTGNGFLHPIAAHRPRTLQFGLKLQF